ncbi:MAG TPA: flagellar biosynthesis protein FlgM [Sedimenticola thiotaurini]|uniref:Flagellar biosynthesis protein FlgM n=1 Tax=Sedimenticola thiotaurini TaxID=1543721 RepID=A0A831W2I9_9GAMM|nr:flagellar biosynthesis protein FlgM [Sedimenticola thiotaurini]
MRWKGRRRSSNVEDRRGRRMVRRAGGGGLGVILLALVAMYFGIDPSIVLDPGSGMSAGSGTGSDSYTPTPEEEQLAAFTSVVLADTEDAWNELFRQMGGNYREPRLVLFSGAVQSACGYARAAMGPFYCPADSRVYIDLGFYRDLKQRHGAPGDFAQAYVIAHEVGHHVQNLLGISGKVQKLRRQLGGKRANALSVRLELQADCLAGVWASHAQRSKQVLEPGDLEEALTAASAIGDDRLQREARGYVAPDSFTHGSSEQRVRWFRRGFESGDLEACDTFGSGTL